MTLRRSMLFTPSILALAISSQFAFADTAADKTEVISVVGARIAYANNSTDDDIKSFSSPLSSTNDLIDKLPGVSVGEGGVFGSDDWSTTISMRGFNLNLNEQQLGITIDGLPNGGSGYGGGSKANRYMLIEDTARVDVMQGTSDISSPSLDALGGTFNYISANPTEQTGATASISTGDYGARKYYARYNTGRVGNTRSVISLGSSHTARWIGSGDNGDSKDLHASYKFISEQDWATLTGRISYDDTNETNYNGITLQQFKENPRWDRLTWIWSGDPAKDQNYAAAWRTLRKNTFAYLRMQMTPSETATVTVTPYYHHMRGRGDWLPPYQVLVNSQGQPILNSTGGTQVFNQRDAQGNPVVDPATQCADNSCSPASSYRHTHYGKARVGSTAKVKWYITDNNILTSGLWLERQDRDEYRDWHAVIDPAVGPNYNYQAYWRQYDRSYRTDTLNYYVQDQVAIGDLKITGGLRQFKVDITRHDNFLGKQTGKLSSNSDVLPMLGAVWSVAPAWEVYGGYSENFKAISDSILETSQDFGSLKAETAKNLDLGLRYFGNNVQLTAALYNIKFDNRITYIQATAGSGIDYLNELDGKYVNVGGIESKGFEASLNWQVTDNLRLYSSLTLNNAKYASSSFVPVAGVLTDIQGKEVAGAPREMAVVNLTYQSGQMRTGLSTKYTGSYFGDFSNNDKLAAHTVMDFYVGYHLDVQSGLDLTLNITNLGDTKYLAGGTNGGYYIGVGRTVTANATMHF